jgi:signal transduction histidine kinase
LLEPLREDGTQANARLPLKRGEEVFGVLSLNFAEARAWDEAERNFAPALARGDAGLRLRQVPLDLGAVLEEVVAEARPLFKQHVLETCLQQPLEVQGDRDQLKQLALILLDNAIKYTPQGGKVRLELKQTERHAEFRVSDTGNGIAAQDLPHVFERFYRADQSRRRDPGGSGLGLSIAKWIVEQHGGEIRLESELGKGTTAIVRLPLPAAG